MKIDAAAQQEGFAEHLDRKKVGDTGSVIIFVFLSFPHADELPILSDLDLNLFGARLLDFALVISLTVFDVLRGFSNRSSR
jgi:hypothetical protein